MFFILVSIPFSVSAGDISSRAKAKYRAAQHPQGSGVGTNRYIRSRYYRVPYPAYDYHRKNSREIKARYRAAQHPQGSGIGTNRYIKGWYGRPLHPIEYYQRQDTNQFFQDD